MKTLTALCAITLFSMAVTGRAGSTEANPFDYYLKDIRKLQEKMETANEKMKASYQKRLEATQKRLDETVAKRKKPYESKLERYTKELAKTKNKTTKQKVQKKIDATQAELDKIDAWANPVAKEKEVVEKKDAKK